MELSVEEVRERLPEQREAAQTSETAPASHVQAPAALLPRGPRLRVLAASIGRLMSPLLRVYAIC